MLAFLWHNLLDIMQRGGLVMWPLLALSLAAVTLILERTWFWLCTNHQGRLVRVSQMAHLLRRGELRAVRVLAESDRSVYGRLVLIILDEGCNEAALTQAIETQRPGLERFMPTLSTIITAAPLLGILGTVTGIIYSFNILTEHTAVTDPRQVSQGIAEALITTAAGLIVAIIVLFPYNVFRAQLDRTLGRIETLATAALKGQEQLPDKKKPEP